MIALDFPSCHSVVIAKLFPVGAPFYLISFSFLFVHLFVVTLTTSTR